MLTKTLKAQSTGTVLLAVILWLLAAPAQALEVPVEIQNVKVNGGRIKLALFVQEGFLKKPYRAQTLEASETSASHVFKDVEPGEYAISVFQDTNGNDKFDMSFFGAPAEPYGLSRNAQGRLGPPAFENAKFSVSGAMQKIVIQLK